ncbi:YetF domain-containing protein [Brachybacterium sp. Marseille-Q7125]|uniref:YetF domain-containing protein n=1 Tax=Brachybacterium sp. Marseille-Q7125 TaxID=2932815 RepID=UPI001FF2B07C|nr:YetF domain-containing protein [Brachybacterium sp. Marseille-Q7125]
MTFLDQLWFQIGITPAGVMGVLLATVTLYLLFTLILQVAGQRLSANPSVLSFAVMALLGALTARAMLGNSPTLLGWLLAVAVLLLLESTLGRIRGGLGRVFRRGGPRASVVMIHGHPLPDTLHQVGMDGEHLTALLRRAGVHHLIDADLVILEPRGSLTVIRRGQQIDPALLTDVRGAERIPPSLLRSAHAPHRRP